MWHVQTDIRGIDRNKSSKMKYGGTGARRRGTSIGLGLSNNKATSSSTDIPAFLSLAHLAQVSHYIDRNEKTVQSKIELVYHHLQNSNGEEVVDNFYGTILIYHDTDTLHRNVIGVNSSSLTGNVLYCNVW